MAKRTTEPFVSRTGDSPLLVSISVMLATIMVIIDMTVVNVSLPQMMGSLGASADQITWVLTSYIVAEAVSIPLGGVLAGRFGRKRLMMFSVAGFVAASALCGQATSLTEIIVLRVLQGACGAAIIPISQSIMAATFPPEKRGKAMAIWGIGVMLGPILGPTLGGIMTEYYNWRWAFYINAPVGILNFFMIASFLRESKTHKKMKIDFLGLALLIIGVGCLQAALDQGNQKNWLDSNLITGLFVFSALGIVSFLLRSWHREDAVLRLQLLKDRNLTLSSLLIMTFGLGMFGTIALQPLMLSELFGYPADTIGLTMTPRGLAAAAGMFFVVQLINRVDTRYLVAFGIFVASIGSYMMARLSLDADQYHQILPAIVQGFGMGMIFVQLSTLALLTLPSEQSDFGAGIFNLSRSLGSSIGIAIASTVLTRGTNAAHVNLVQQIRPDNPNLELWLERHHLSLHTHLALEQLYQLANKQALMLGFVHAFSFVALSFIMLIPLVFFLRRPE